jgi:hypothetical protein
MTTFEPNPLASVDAPMGVLFACDHQWQRATNPISRAGPHRPCRSSGLPTGRPNRTTNSGTATNCCATVNHPATKHESFRASGREGQLDQLYLCLWVQRSGAPARRVRLEPLPHDNGAIVPADWLRPWGHRLVRCSPAWNQRHSHTSRCRTYSGWGVSWGNSCRHPGGVEDPFVL